jgi:hypothetical protein
MRSRSGSPTRPVPLDVRRPPTVVWSPVGFTHFHLGVPNIELDADAWRSCVP